MTSSRSNQLELQPRVIVHQSEFESGRTAYQTVMLTITLPVVNFIFSASLRAARSFSDFQSGPITGFGLRGQVFKVVTPPLGYQLMRFKSLKVPRTRVERVFWDFQSRPFTRLDTVA